MRQPRVRLALPFSLLAGALLPCFTSGLAAQPIETWTYQRLVDESDLVVIATPTATKDTGERKEKGVAVAPQVGGFDGKVDWLPCFGVDTEFRVAAVLKGDKTLKTFLLHYYRLEKGQRLINPPFFLSFDPSKKRSFLLFLKRGLKGRYEPTSGQENPALYSVHALNDDLFKAR